MNKIIENAFSLIPPDWLHQAVIAGGAAACLEKASDIDIFILDVPCDYDVQALRNAIQNIPGIVMRGDKDPKYTDDFNVIADIPGLIPVQIIASKFETVDELLRDFDISTHAVAITPDGLTHTIPAFTGQHQTPRVMTLRNPELTLARYRRICLRYDLTPDANELVRLCTTPDRTPESPENVQQSVSASTHTNSIFADDDIPF